MAGMGADKVSRKHLQRRLDERAAAYKEDVAREKRTYGEIRPMEAQVGTKTWKSYSRIRGTSPEFRKGYDGVNWGV